MKSLKSTVLSSLFWKLMERSGTQGIQFIVQIVLARLLAPEQFGTIAIVMVFVSVARVFVESGFNTALIQKKDSDEVDFSSVFYISLLIAGALYILIYISAPFISDFYREPILVPVLRVLSLTLFFGVFNSIQNAYIAKNMMFKKLFTSSLGAIIISGVLGIIAAYQGLGVWALVIQQLVNQISITVLLLFIVKWRPKLIFSYKRVKILFSYGWKLLISALLNVLYIELRTLIIGRTYSSSMLGFYNRGEQFPKVIVLNINGSIQSVMLPTLSSYQDNRKKVKDIVRRSIVTSSFMIFPIMIGLAVVAEPLVKIVLTDKWIPSVPFLQIFCISYALMPIHTANLQAINAMGRSDIFLKLEIVKKILGVIILIISIPFGIYAIALGMVINNIIASFINAYPNKQLLNYSYKEQWVDIMPSFLITLVMGTIVYLFNFINIAAWKILTYQVIVGVITYIVLAKVFRLESFRYLLESIRQLIKFRTKS
ncbi:lipopolysaccharide biosynthesis protein [Senegalia massiliensis]|uniref:Lipopolysaccharide biosynthesis protein n=1 Tax=Senegalia massiliensis TaxID=1720316 RepID=A0A845QVT5_9CLOT|nr:lipopolysaccharide biosynthesis protein [Senegalia massiliensis]NBI07037.1 lipopolysaccharide biosynthesis protein [Senegalia massiliensis]